MKNASLSPAPRTNERKISIANSIELNHLSRRIYYIEKVLLIISKIRETMKIYIILRKGRSLSGPTLAVLVRGVIKLRKRGSINPHSIRFDTEAPWQEFSRGTRDNTDTPEMAVNRSRGKWDR